MPRRLNERPVALQVAVVVLGFAVAGAICGVLWEWWWSPAQGVVVKKAWYPISWDLAQPADFRGTAWYVAISVVAGALLGALAAWRLHRSPIATLVAVVVGSLVGAYLMRDIGYSLSPEDPALLATTAKEGTMLPSNLTLASWWLIVSFPGAALAGIAVVNLSTSSHERVREIDELVDPGARAVNERDELSSPE